MKETFCTTEHYWYLVAKYWSDPNSLTPHDVAVIEDFQAFSPVKELAIETRTKL